ncbi:MAG: sulfite exporter TauE/SafE family protein [Thermoanaerobaculales bacterium]|nr:sulfite exporter TauE/SafE family protein [Thermoanaerobaculales bacterium]
MVWPEILAVVFPTPWHFLVACLALLVAEMVYVLLGFGAGLISVGTLAFLLPEVRDVIVLILLVNLPAELYVVWASRQHIRWRGVAVLSVGIAVGIPIGAWMLTFSEPTLLLGLLGAVLVLVGTTFLILKNETRASIPAWSSPFVGLTSGLLAGLFGTGGPPVVLHYRLQGLAKTAFRGNLMALFLLMNLTRFPSYCAMGLVTTPRVIASAAVLPAVLVGAVLGHHIHLALSETIFRRWVNIGLVILGLLLLVRSAG